MAAALLAIVLARGTRSRKPPRSTAAHNLHHPVRPSRDGVLGVPRPRAAARDALRVAPIDRLSGAVTLVLAVLLRHARASAPAWVGTAVMLVGAVIVARS